MRSLIIAAVLFCAGACEAQQYQYGSPYNRLSYSWERGYYTPGFQGDGSTARNWRGPVYVAPRRSVTTTRNSWMRFENGNPVQWDIGGVGRTYYGRQHYNWLGFGR